jgi:phosphoadenosine phosphosulfate reductase
MAGVGGGSAAEGSAAWDGGGGALHAVSMAANPIAGKTRVQSRLDASRDGVIAVSCVRAFGRGCRRCRVPIAAREGKHEACPSLYDFLMALDVTTLAGTAADYASRSPQEILALALQEYSPELGISFSGAEDVVLVDMAARLRIPFRVFSLDTGRLHPETYQFLDKVRAHYGVSIEAYSPQAEAVQTLVRDKGLFSFYVDGHKECCGIRKVEPLMRALAPLRAWVTGQRKDQSPGTRADVPVVQIDRTFGTPDRPLVKFNPLSFWTSQQVWAYIRDNEVPYNALHDRGFISIGCEPCTRPVNPGQHERAGRWWWEEETKKECGLHAANTR